MDYHTVYGLGEAVANKGKGAGAYTMSILSCVCILHLLKQQQHASIIRHFKSDLPQLETYGVD